MRWLLYDFVCLLLLVAFNCGAGYAQVKYPTPPEKYQVQIRYRIEGSRNVRVLQYEEMTKYFAKCGFEQTPDDDNDLAAFDLTAEMMDGTAPSNNVREILKDRRVQTMLLLPDGLQMDTPTDEYRIAIYLRQNPSQRLLFDQALVVLKALKFSQDIGYDNRGYQLIRGRMPASEIPKLLRDLRNQPSGWFLPNTPEGVRSKTLAGNLTGGLAAPLRDVVPVVLAEVLGKYQPPAMLVELPPVPEDQPYQIKWTPGLRRFMADPERMEQPLRLELILSAAPEARSVTWREPFEATGAVIEGQFGPIVSVYLKSSAMLGKISALQSVITVRLPRTPDIDRIPMPEPKEPKPDLSEIKLPISNQQLRQATDTIQLPLTAPDADPLKTMGLTKLHQFGARGARQKVVIIDSDFSGWEDHLPPDPKKPNQYTLIDLTAARNRNVEPDPMPGELGRGAHCAKIVHLTAPDSDILMIRVAPDSAYQVSDIINFIRGTSLSMNAIKVRRDEIAFDTNALRNRRAAAIVEYNQAFADFSADAAAEKRRRDAQAAFIPLREDEEKLLARIKRLDLLEQNLIGIYGANVVLNLIHWNHGYGLDGANPFTRALDNWLVPVASFGRTRQLVRREMPPPPVWIQAAGDNRGQSWVGRFIDRDDNGVMEFAGNDQLLANDRWSRELNFLAIDQGMSKQFLLPAGTKVRISLQWREPHDETFSEDEYRIPILPFQVQLIKQRDPEGKTSASDEIDLVAVTEGLAERLHFEPNFAVYERMLEMTIPEDGHFAVRIVGQLPISFRPVGLPTIGDNQQNIQVFPRLFVEGMNGKRIILGDFASERSVVPVPAESRGVFTVGAVGSDGKPRLRTNLGAGPLAELMIKPDYYAPDQIPGLVEEPVAYGSDVSASLAAGWSASMLSVGARPVDFHRGLGLPKGSLIVVPKFYTERRR
ncbi:MAG: hypothetical protein R3B84_15740 [Zavarzinella sp.]